MAALAGFYFLAGLVLVGLALIPKSPVRRWLTHRRRPGIAGSALLGAWLVGLMLLFAFIPPTPENTASEDADTTETSAPALPRTTTPEATSSANTPAPSTKRSPTAQIPNGVPADAQKATVARIVDGDTLELSAVTAGEVLASTQQIDARLLAIDTPETQHPSEPVQCYGKQATNQLGKLAPPGSTVWVQRDQELRDQYGRYLLYLWNNEGTFVNVKMVRDGYGQAELHRPNDKHWTTISAADTDARSAAAGLWAACANFGAPAHTPEPEPQPEPQEGREDYLFPPPPPDKDCGDVSASNFRVRPGDPHRFDADGDGIGCES